MALPKIQTPTFELKLPSSGKKLRYRGFLVKEEKILLAAKEEGSKKAAIDAFKQIAVNCVIEEIDVDDLPLFDLEYLFLMIRSKSQNNLSRIKYKDGDVEYDAIFDFEKIKVSQTEGHSDLIDLDGNVGLTMRYPSIRDFEELEMYEENEINPSKMVELIKRCIKNVYDADNVYPMSEASEEEKNEFFESLDHGHFAKIQNFFTTFPEIVGYIEYKKDKEKIVKEVKGVSNFLS